jgi:hypothetical protein
MNWQRDKAIIISGGVCLVLAGVAIFLIIKFGGAYKQAVSDLESADDQIAKLSRSKVYPNAANLKILNVNNDGLSTFKEGELARLRDRQFKSLPMTPTDFIDDVKGRFAALRQKSVAVLGAAAERDKVGDEALEVNSAIKDDFFGSFERYGSEGFPPDEEHLPRLTIQLQTIDELCKTMVILEVAEVLSVAREMFDGQSAGSSRSAGDEPEVPALQEAEYYSLAFLAPERVTWRVLQELSNADSLYAITELRFKNENPGMQTDMNITVNSSGGGGGGGGGGGLAAFLKQSQPKPKASTSAENAIRPGKELVRTDVKLKVTRFPEPPAPAGSDAPEPEGDDTQTGEER